MNSKLVTRFREKEVSISTAESQPAEFIDERDRIVLQLCASLYTDPIQEKDGWVISDEGTV